MAASGCWSYNFKLAAVMHLAQSTFKGQALMVDHSANMNLSESNNSASACGEALSQLPYLQKSFPGTMEVTRDNGWLPLPVVVVLYFASRIANCLGVQDLDMMLDR